MPLVNWIWEPEVLVRLNDTLTNAVKAFLNSRQDDWLLIVPGNIEFFEVEAQRRGKWKATREWILMEFWLDGGVVAGECHQLCLHTTPPLPFTFLTPGQQACSNVITISVWRFPSLLWYSDTKAYPEEHPHVEIKEDVSKREGTIAQRWTFYQLGWKKDADK